MNPLSESDAHRVWDVLVAHVGVDDDPLDRAAFVDVQSSLECREWRFVGSLGYGGKFRRERRWIGPDLHERWFVDCYREDETDARRHAIDACNTALAELTREKTP